MSNKQKLELTWIGKDKRPKLEPRILLEDAAKSYHAKARVSECDHFDNRLIFGDNLLALKALEAEFTGKVKCVSIANKDTVLFLGVWEQLNNPGFNSLEFEGTKNEAGRNSFFLSAKKWIETTGAIGLHAKAGRYGGTFADKDIAFEFGSWLSPEFKLYLIKEFQRLKDEESRATSLEWSFQRTLAKVNYKIHTDAIKARLIPPLLTPAQTGILYASEADLLNVALFGITAAQWRQANPEQSGNMRDAATLEQLVVLSNLESINAVFIHQGLGASERLAQLNHIAITQMRSLMRHKPLQSLAGANRKELQ